MRNFDEGLPVLGALGPTGVFDEVVVKKEMIPVVGLRAKVWSAYVDGGLAVEAASALSAGQRPAAVFPPGS